MQQLLPHDLELAQQIQEIIGHTFTDFAFARDACTAQIGTQQRPKYERSEFIGDRLVRAQVTEFLLAQRAEWTSATLSSAVDSIVSNFSLASIGYSLGVDRLVRSRHSTGVGSSGDCMVVADVLEALCGAVYADAGIAAAHAAFTRAICPSIVAGLHPDVTAELSRLLVLRGQALAMSITTDEIRFSGGTGYFARLILGEEVELRGYGRSQALATAFVEREGVALLASSSFEEISLPGREYHDDTLENLATGYSTDQSSPPDSVDVEAYAPKVVEMYGNALAEQIIAKRLYDHDGEASAESLEMQRREIDNEDFWGFLGEALPPTRGTNDISPYRDKSIGRRRMGHLALNGGVEAALVFAESVVADYLAG